MTTAADLAIGVTTDVDVSGFRDVSSAAAAASSAVTEMGDDAATSARKLSISADGADEFAGKTGKATGALGALAGGLEAVGLEQYAGALQGASIATDVASGASDALNLIMESSIAKNLAAKAATVGSTIATGAQTVATGALTASQAALNAVMALNPFVAAAIAAVALVGIFVLLYKKSDTFRGAVQAVGKAGKAAFDLVVGGAKDLVGWVGDKIPGGFSTAQKLAVGYIKLITLPIRTTVDVVKSLVGFVKDDLPDAFDDAVDKAKDIGDDLLKPFKAVKDLIGDIKDAISSIKLPKLPDLNPFSRVSASAYTGAGGTGLVTVAGGVNNYYVTVQGAIDPYSTAQQVDGLLSRYARNLGQP